MRMRKEKKSEWVRDMLEYFCIGITILFGISIVASIVHGICLLIRFIL